MTNTTRPDILAGYPLAKLRFFRDISSEDRRQIFSDPVFRVPAGVLREMVTRGAEQRVFDHLADRGHLPGLIAKMEKAVAKHAVAAAAAGADSKVMAYLNKKMQGYVDEYCTMEPDTGAVVCGNMQDTIDQLAEIIEECESLLKGEIR